MTVEIPDAPAVRSDVPVDLHPDALSGYTDTLDVEASIGRYVLADGRTALAAAYGAIGGLNDAENAVREATPSTGQVVENGRVGPRFAPPDELFVAADKALQRATRQIDARAASLANHIQALETRVVAALEDPVTKTPVAAEIRSHVKGAKNRMGFLAKAVEAGDKTTIAAVLAAPAYLSGLDEKAHATVRDMAADRFARTDFRQLRAAREIAERVASSGSRVVARYSKILALKNSPGVKASRLTRALAEGKA